MKCSALTILINAHLRFMCSRGWAEVSDKLETLCARALGPKWEIDPQYLADNHIFSEMKINEYDNHYERPLRKGGPMLTKIAYGTIRL